MHVIVHIELLKLTKITNHSKKEVTNIFSYKEMGPNMSIFLGIQNQFCLFSTLNLSLFHAVLSS